MRRPWMQFLLDMESGRERTTMACGNAVIVGVEYVEQIRLKATYGTITTAPTAV